jgi:hypothetical protein
MQIVKLASFKIHILFFPKNDYKITVLFAQFCSGWFAIPKLFIKNSHH